MKGIRVDVAGRIGTLDLEVALETAGSPLVLVGPNGSGKTSILLMIVGAMRPLRGTIDLDGETLFDGARGIDRAPEHRGLGYVPQDCGLFPHMTAAGNVAFGLECRHHLSRAERRRRAHALLEQLEVAHLAERLPSSLSGGEAQRVALARALAAEPRALLLDEPLAALDAAVRRQLRTFLPERIRALGLPTIVVTHDAADAAAFAADIAVIESGHVAQRGRLEALRSAPATEFVRELFSA